jgi:GDPmannose 4,6-dehydratase
MTKKPRALITGITGQDASYLAELLLEKGYEVFGIHRRSSVDGHFDRIKHLAGKIKLICADMTDLNSLEKAFEEAMPDEVYNLAAQSQVGVSFNQPFYTYETNWLGVERIIHCIKKYVPNAKLYQCSTSELFGDVLETPQNENTPFNPLSPYAKAKLKAHEVIQRERKNGIFACAGILFNHTSPNRSTEFVTRKITDGFARIKLGLPQKETGKKYLELGNLSSKRDFGYAKDYVKAMWMMLQQDKPKDYVISSGETRTIKEFVEIAAKCFGYDLNWKGSGLNEEGYDQDGNLLIKISEKYFRPNEVNLLLGDSSLAKKEIGWYPETSFKDLVKLMVEKDLDRLKNEKG